MRAQYRVILTIHDDCSPRRDVEWSIAYPAHKTLKSAVNEFKELRKVIDTHKLNKLEAEERRLLMKEILQ